MTLASKFAAGAGAAFFGALALTFAVSATSVRAEDKPAAAGEAAAEAHPHPHRQPWSFAGPFGKFDRAQLQRGYQVYKEVCSACHSMRLVAFRDLEENSGPAFSESQVKALAATFKVKDGPNEAGEMFERPGRPSDAFPSPFPNPQAARAALGAIPPDMSVLAKARDLHSGFPGFVIDAFTQYQEGGPDYIYALLNGYTKPDDPNFNAIFPGQHIAMPPPLSDGLVDYTDGAPKTTPQYAKDVTAFLMWAAEPKLEARKSLGFAVIIYLAVFAGLLYTIKKRLWAKVPH
ncbi:cytochrome c1 [Methylocella silvestris]|uniref:Cytochrome c1 n=1 Tax=Methylocella silvestris TaxID=199596 RepID=A0A2J7TMQ3_METSI|nr:cytochrome c1 [Methylocella silvestris]PNG28056.1 cytochrome c1 [Methylocella silvestris]